MNVCVYYHMGMGSRGKLLLIIIYYICINSYKLLYCQTKLEVVLSAKVPSKVQETGAYYIDLFLLCVFWDTLFPIDSIKSNQSTSILGLTWSSLSVHYVALFMSSHREELISLAGFGGLYTKPITTDCDIL